jgi:hypothetical protein
MKFVKNAFVFIFFLAVGFLGTTALLRAGSALHVLAVHGQVKAANPGAPVLSYQQWRDPAEGAFTVSLPRGWQTSIGTQRTTRLEPHYVVRANSPTGGVQMFMDDPRIALRQIPNQFYPTEGQIIPAVAGAHLLVENYRPAPQAAEEYVLKALCPSATHFKGGPIPGQSRDLGNQFNQIAHASGMQMRVDVGEISFRCNERAGYVYAITSQVTQPGGSVSLWFFYRIAGYLATPAESSQAADAVDTMLASFQYNQLWLQHFAQESNDIAGNVIAASNAITKASIERAQQQQAQEQAEFEATRKRDNESFQAQQRREREANASSSGSGDGNGHDYNPQLNTKTVCDDAGSCDYWADANVTNYWFDCAGKAHPGSESGDPPPSSESACWRKGH